MLIEFLSEKTKLTIEQIEWFAKTASKRYYVYPIDKKNGKGRRWIEQPSRGLKVFQRWINRSIFLRLPLNPCATAYQKGSSTLKNAAAHKDYRFTLRLDFKDFFPSFKSEHVHKFVTEKNVEIGLGLSAKDILFSVNIVSRNGCLTIGAPSSPIQTNAMMFSFDEQVMAESVLHKIIYTRYADDMFFSSNDRASLSNIHAFVKKKAVDYPYGGLKINEEKTAYLSRRFKRSVTGLIITPDRKLSIGRSLKKKIKTMCFLHLKKKNSPDDEEYLRGMIAYVSHVEPSFILSLRRKFGDDLASLVSPRESSSDV